MFGRSALTSRRILSRPQTLSQRKFNTAFWKWTTQPRPTWRESYSEAAILFTVLGVTGTSSLVFVRPFLEYTIGLKGSFSEGPNSYRVLSIVLVSPIYACMLVTFGTLSGRHTYFAGMGRKIIGRFMPASLLRKVTCTPAQQKFDSIAKK